MASRPRPSLRASWRALALTVAALLPVLIGGGCRSAHERDTKATTLASLEGPERRAVEEVARRAAARCCTIRPAFLTLGSGCVVSETGWILTAEHVVRGRRTVDVELADGRTYEGDVVAASEGNDFALVKIEAAGLAAFAWGPRPSLGDRVVAVGTQAKAIEPLNASTGVVIYPRVRIPGDEGTYYFDAIFHSAPIFPGDSGGPLVDMEGRLVGLHGGFASESASVAPALDEVRRTIPGGATSAALSLDLFRPARRPGSRAGPPPGEFTLYSTVALASRVPKDFAESSAWTVRSVEPTLVEVYQGLGEATVRRVLQETRRRYLEMRPSDDRRDDDLVRAMLTDIFRDLEAHSKRVTAAPRAVTAARAACRNSFP